MNIDQHRLHDYLLRARAEVFDRVRSLSPAQYTQAFPIGLGSIARVLTHIYGSEWYYVERMLKHEVPPYSEWPIRDENPPDFHTLEAEWTRQTARTRDALTTIADWSAPIEYRVVDDDGRLLSVTTTPADIFTQLVMHEVYHRAQVMNMLRHLGITAGDLDYNALMYDRRVV